MKKMTFLLLLAVMVSACGTAVAPTPTPIPPTAVPTQDPKALAAEIDALVQENYQKGVYDGAVLVARDGQVILSQGYGFNDPSSQVIGHILVPELFPRREEKRGILSNHRLARP